MMLDRQKKIVASVVGVVLLIAIISAVIFFSRTSCKLLADEPKKPTDAKLENLASDDLRAVGNFHGYLKYDFKDKNNKDVYLPLNVNSINWKKVNNSDDLQYQIKADCATITFAIYPDETDRKLKVETININMAVANTEGSYVCIIKKPKIQFARGKHYKCQKRTSHRCYSLKDNIPDSDSVTTFVVNELEFEVNGKPEIIKDKQFSTDPEYC